MWGKNPYYNPEALGLQPVAELEFSDMNYVFDTRVVWKNGEGALFTARDSGCSCPTPFENFTSVAMLDRVDYRELEKEVKDELRSDWGGNPNFARDSQSFLKTVREALD